MTDVEKIERAIAALSRAELAELRHWFAQFDAASWDQQLEADIAAGKLDRLADEAVADHRSGRSRPL